MTSNLHEGETVLLLIIMLFAFQVCTTREAHADYSVSISGNSVSVNIDTLFQQNMTLTPTPSYSLVMVGANASSPQATFTTALSKLASSAQVSDLHLSSSSSGNVTHTTVSFTVLGVTTSSQGAFRLMMGWKSFEVPQDITASGISLNAVGQYLAASPLLGRQSSSVVTWTYFEDNKIVSSAQSLQTVSSFIIFDFSQLSAPLSSWSKHFAPDGGGFTILNRSLQHNVTIVETLSSEGGSVKTSFVAGYSHRVQFTVAGFANVQGDTIFNGSTGIVIGPMLAIAIILPITGVVAYMIEWRFYRRPNPFSKRRKRENKS